MTQVVTTDGEILETGSIRLFHFADTETSDMKPFAHGGGVCELSIRVTGPDFEPISDFYTKMDPEGPISPSASGVHGIRDRDVEFEPTMTEYLEEVLGDANPWRQDADPIYLICHNVRFDWKFLARYVKCPVALVDTLLLARRYYPDAPDHKLQTLRVWLDLPFDVKDSHSAHGDTQSLMDLVKRISKDTGKSLTELCIDAQRREPVIKFPFGKLKGQVITEAAKTDPRYLRWMLKNITDMDPDLKLAINNALGQ